MHDSMPLRFEGQSEAVKGFADAILAAARGSKEVLRFLIVEHSSQLWEECTKISEGVRTAADGASYEVRFTLDYDDLRRRLARLTTDSRAGHGIYA